MTAGGMGRRAVRGTIVTASAQGTRLLLQVASVVILARLLTPVEYGLFAIVGLVIGLSEVMRDFGLTNAAVQAKSLSSAERDNLFWLNSVLGFLLGVTAVGLSWPVAWVFDRAALAPLIQGVAVVFLINGCATQVRAHLLRQLRFTALAVIDIGAAAVGLVTAVSFALQGWGAWSLVFQVIAQALFVLAAVLVAARWLPGLPHKGVPMYGFIRFGYHMVGTQLVGYIGNNVDTAIIGFRLNPASLGIYSRAFQLIMVPTGQLRAPITNVAIPVLSRLQDDKDRYWQAIKLGQLAVGYGPVLMLGLAIGLAEPLVNVMLGADWMAAAPVLSLLAVAAVFQTLNMGAFWIYVSLGLTRELFQYNLISVAIKVCFVVAGSHWGMVGVAAGYMVAPAVSWPISLWWLSRAAPGAPIKQLGVTIVRVSLLTLTAAGAAYAASLLADGPLGQMLYGALGWGILTLVAVSLIPCLRRDARALRGLSSFIRKPKSP